MRKEIVGLALCIAVFAPGAVAQSAESPEQTLNFPLPVATGNLGVQASGAVSEVSAYNQAVSSTGWQDLEATGTLTYPKGDEHSVTLDLQGPAFTRLDVTLESGTLSLRLEGALGKFQDASGNTFPLLPSTSQSAVLAFPRVWTDAATSKSISLFDQGQYAGTGANLHRITIEFPLDRTSHTPGPSTEATDLYFDPSSHLLLYSVDAVTFDNSAGQSFTRVTSYGSYQRFSGVLVPTAIQQTLNGQLQWKLQLSQVAINTNPPASTFSF